MLNFDSVLGPALFLLLFGCGSSTEDAGRTELVRIERPSSPEIGELAVNDDGRYLHWFPGDASRAEQRGALTAEQLEVVRRATTEEARQVLMACAAADFDSCTNEQEGYVMTTLAGTACWIEVDVIASCGAAGHFMVLRDLLHSMAN